MAGPPTASGLRESAKAVAAANVDSVELSAAGTALAGMDGDGGIRFEKVARVRSEIQAGTYDVAGKLDMVHDRILDDVLA